MDGEVVGFAAAIIPADGTEAELLTLYILQRAQGRGFGRQLMTDIAGRMQRQGAMSLMLWMAVGNPTAGFYAHMGGAVVETEAKPFGSHTVMESRYRWADIEDLGRIPPVDVFA